MQTESMKETASINKSIFVLGTVVYALAKRSTSEAAKSGSQHVPYRNSVLTRLLRTALDGHSNCSILACVSPDHADADET